MVELKINEEFRALIQPLSEDEFKDLEKSILEEGIRDPLYIWKGFIIDGHHRYELAKKHNLDFKIHVMEFVNEVEAKIWMIQNQLARRNLNPAQRINLQVELEPLHKASLELERKAEMDRFVKEGKPVSTKPITTRQSMADAAGVGHGTVWRFKEVKTKALDPDVEHVPKEIFDKVMSGELPISTAHKEIRRTEKKIKAAEEMKEAAKYYKPVDNIKIVHADFYPWCNENLEDDSVDLILTDPPYPKEFLYLWDELGEVAARVLKPGGYLATYSGQLYLDHVMSVLGEHLSYVWTMALQHKGATQLVNPRQLICAWKPILIYTKGDAGKIISASGSALVDFIGDDYREKGFHEWGQGETAVGYIMKTLSKPNELVLDPFVGGGTTLVVARDLKRKCIGIEIDEQYIDIIKSNILKPKQEELF